jgi:hypothetical protein
LLDKRQWEHELLIQLLNAVRISVRLVSYTSHLKVSIHSESLYITVVIIMDSLTWLVPAWYKGSRNIRNMTRNSLTSVVQSLGSIFPYSYAGNCQVTRIFAQTPSVHPWNTAHCNPRIRPRGILISASFCQRHSQFRQRSIPFNRTQSTRFFSCSSVRKMRMVVGCNRVHAGTHPLNMNIGPSFRREVRITPMVDCWVN